MERITDFFRGVAREMRKTSWPKRDELVKSTITVMVTVAIMMAFFALIDMGFSELIRVVIE